MEGIGKRLEDLMKKRGLTQRELASRSGVSESMISQLKNDTKGAKTETFLRLSEVLGCTVDYLLKGEPEPKEEEDEEYMPDVAMIARAGKRVTPERRKEMIAVLRIAFPEAFDDKE